MTDFEKTIIKRNENWIKASKMQINDYKMFIAHEEICIKDLAEQNRIIKERNNGCAV